MRRAASWLLLLTLLPLGCRRPPTRPSTATAYNVAADPTVNPSQLFMPPPNDASLVANDETLYRCMRGSPSNLCSLFASSIYDKSVEEYLYDRPFSFDATLNWQLNESMVESYKENDDHRSAVLILRAGLKWQDGEDYDAHDIVYSWQRIMDDRVPCPSAKSGTERITRCVAIDDRTVTYQFAAPSPVNKWSVNFPIVPQHLYRSGDSKDPTLITSNYFAQLNREPIGNGPYRFVEWISDDRIVLKRWRAFHGQSPYFKRIVIRIIPDEQLRLAAFLRREIDEMFLSQSQFLNSARTPQFESVGVRAFAPRWVFYYIGWNQDGSNPFFTDRRIRIAMSHAFNHKRIGQQVFKGLYPRSHGLFHPNSPMFPNGLTLYEFDLNRAAALMDEAGWIVDDSDGWRYKSVEQDGRKKRVRFSFELSLAQESSTGPLLAAIVQEDLRTIGVEMKTTVMEWTTFKERRRKHEFQACYSSWTAGVDPSDVAAIVSKNSYDSGYNDVGYTNERVEMLLKNAERCFDEPERMRLYGRIAKLFYEDAGYTFIVDAPLLWGFSQRLRGIQFSPRGPTQFTPGPLNWWVPKELATSSGESR